MTPAGPYRAEFAPQILRRARPICGAKAKFGVTLVLRAS